MKISLKVKDSDPVKMTVREAVPVGGAFFDIDNETLIMEGGVIRVNTANAVEQDNSLPITSAAVYTTVGNIGAILDTI